MSKLLFICPSHRDHRELARLGVQRDHELVFHDYASVLLEEIARRTGSTADVSDVRAELQRILRNFGDTGLDGVVSTDDYPSSALASFVARRLGAARHVAGLQSALPAQIPFTRRGTSRSAALPKSCPGRAGIASR